MRTTLVFLFLFSLACSKSTPGGETDTRIEATPTEATVAKPGADAPTSPEPAAAAPAPESIPVVTLLEAGKPPLQALRRSFTAGQKETMTLEAGESIRLKGGGWNVLHNTLALLQTIDVETKAVSRDGVAEVTLTIRDAEEVEGSVEKPTTKQMNPTGVTGSYQIDTRGIVTGLDLVPPPNNSKVKKTFLDAARNKLRWMAPPFPKEPVGVGAKWKVTREVNEFLTRMKEEATVELIERKGSEIVLRFEVKGTGVALHDTWKPPQKVEIDMKTSGQATLALDKVAPRASKLEQQNVQKQSFIGVDVPPDKEALQTLTLTTAIESQ